MATGNSLNLTRREIAASFSANERVGAPATLFGGVH
jgi:hypothetical protein